MGLSLENDTTEEKSIEKNSSPLELAKTFPTRKKTRREERGEMETINTTANSFVFSSILFLWLQRSVFRVSHVNGIFRWLWKKIFTRTFAIVFKQLTLQGSRPKLRYASLYIVQYLSIIKNGTTWSVCFVPYCSRVFSKLFRIYTPIFQNAYEGSVQKPNSWTYKFVEVSGHNL
jgi:hypothetical protein